MTETPFVEGTTPDAYNADGTPNAVALQVAPVPSEDGGYKAPGGGVRRSIRDRITAARRYKAETVPVEEWDAEIEVRSLTLGERNELLSEILDEEGNGDFKLIFAPLLIGACYDPETGEKVFAPDDAATINGLDPVSVDKVAEVALRLSGLDQKAKDNAAGKSSKTASSV